MDNQRILVIGDSMLDRYIVGDAAKISPEAPVIDFHIDGAESDDKAGGAANVVANLSSMDACGYFVTCTGDDTDGLMLEARINSIEGFSHTYMQIPLTTCKTRLIDRRHNQCILRISSEKKHKPLVAEIRKYLTDFRANIDAIVISDYDKGTINSEVIDDVLHFATINSVPLIGDPKSDNFSDYHHFDCIVPNHIEAANFLGISAADVLETPVVSAVELVKKLELGSAIITLGADGAAYANQELSGVVPTEKRDVYDVSGAGDTFTAVISMLWNSMSMRNMIVAANTIAGLGVEHMGNYKPTASTFNEVLGNINESRGEQELYE